MSAASIEIPVLLWAHEEEEATRLAGRLGDAGMLVRRLDDEEAVFEACSAAPCSFLVLRGESSRALALCARIRDLPDGDRATIAVVVDGDDARDEALAAGADITWPVHVRDDVIERALRRASARFVTAQDCRPVEEAVVSSMIESAPQGVFVVSDVGVIRAANTGVRAMLGHQPSALEGRSLSDLVHPEDERLVGTLVLEAASSRDLAAPAVVRMRRHDGSFVEVELAARNMLHEPAIRGVLVDARDASERMSVGAALQESEMRFGAIFENLLDGLVQIDDETRRLVQANPAFCRITGHSPEEISSLTLLDLFPAAERDAARKILEAHFRGERGVSEALYIQHKNGTPLYVDLGTTRMELSGVRFMLAVIRDVTARRESERTRELFLAVVAHELRTPVAVLQNSVELLKAQRQPSPEDREVIVGVLDEEVQRLGRLVADALDLGAIHAGTLTLRPHRVELGPLVRSVVARVAPQFDGRPHVHIEQADASVDPLRFEQIVTNLVDNAWRHGGEPDIEVSLVAEDGHARLDVVDRGPGLPESMRESIFERVLLPSERPTAGIGIGMWLSKRLVDTMGGTIHASSGAEGRGLRVTVFFPLLEDASRERVV